MKDLVNLIDEELNSCKGLLEAVEGNLKHLPEGSLVVNIKKNKPFYSQYSKADGIKYIPKDNAKLASELADKEACEIIRSCLTKEIKPLEKARAALVTNVFCTDEEYAKFWSEYLVTDVNPLGVRSIKTRRGDLVRSKSEKIIADLLFDVGVYYRYEAPLYLKNGAKFYPDFTLLDVRSRSEIYWEHFGMIDDEKLLKSREV